MPFSKGIIHNVTNFEKEKKNFFYRFLLLLTHFLILLIHFLILLIHFLLFKKGISKW